ncbi:hypothetical protein D043_0972B, partial [Vibrio parahaemolyticus EKP-021]
SNKVSP